MASDNTSKVVAETSEPQKIRFNYLKSSHYRDIHVDGALGGLTPQGLIHMAVFSERFPIPQLTTQSLIGGALGQEIKEERVSREGIIREVEAGFYMSLDIAASLAAWLTQKIEEAKKVQTIAESKAGEKAGGAK